MNSIKNITHFENWRRLERLNDFHSLVVTYFNNSQVTDWITDPRRENETARHARRKINLLIDEVHETVTAAGIDCSIDWIPPRIVGGPTRNIDVLMNLFDLHRLQIPDDHAIGFLERSIGKYQSDRQNSIVRTYNPFWWLKRFLIWFSQVPFFVLRVAGFDADRLERSMFGRLIKALVAVIPVIASLLMIADYLGALEWVKSTLGIVSSS